MQSGDWVEEGKVLHIEVTPNEGYELVSLLANGEDISASKEYLVKGAVNIVAAFELQQFVISFAQPENGALKVMLDQSELTSGDKVDYGSKITVEVTPNEGYELVSLLANGVDISAGKEYTVKSAVDIVAAFELQQFVISFTQPENGTLKVMKEDLEIVNGESVAYGSQLSVVAEADEGYVLESLTANGVDILSSASFVVLKDTELIALFKSTTGLNQYQTADWITLYPNPAKDKVSISVSADLVGKQLYLSDIRGRILMTQVIESENSLINTESLKAGVYFLRIADWVERLIVK